ncbi:MAG: SGNH/GDSL hydrolase family protein [Deltaproteobacteria bacterium]|nr:SGNH/GDSL hydrolase family protein [Deltaproteobacteria bacterium]
MSVRLEEIRARLLSPDEEVVEDTLREHFTPVRRQTPLTFDWCPAWPVPPNEEHEDWLHRVGWEFIALANRAERRVRNWKFRRRLQRRPGRPVVVCEGDSWVAHPLLEDIADHLFDDDGHDFNIWSKGAAGDLLADIEHAAEHETALAEVEASAMLLSAGGNDLLTHFGEFLIEDAQTDDPAQRITPQVDVRMAELMCGLRRLVQGVHAVDPALPVVVHGYDYLQVADFGRGRFLGEFFDRAGLRGPDRQATLTHIVDRYNEHVQAALADLPCVHYVNVRGAVEDRDDWFDEIHPKGRGFREVTERIGAVLREVVVAARRS